MFKTTSKLVENKSQKDRLYVQLLTFSFSKPLQVRINLLFVIGRATGIPPVNNYI